MLQYCAENGYLAAAEKLQQEAGLAISKFEVVENLDLLRIIQVRTLDSHSDLVRIVDTDGTRAFIVRSTKSTRR